MDTATETPVDNPLHILQNEVRLRTDAIQSAQPCWPCRKGCDDCCRHLAAVPSVTQPEWQLLSTHLQSLPADIAASIRHRIRNAALEAPVCPMLDLASGACLVYRSRPIACRSYGFYVEREAVLGCNRVHAISRESDTVIWGNHNALEQKLRTFGESRPIYEWLAAEHHGDSSSQSR